MGRHGQWLNWFPASKAAPVPSEPSHKIRQPHVECLSDLGSGGDRRRVVAALDRGEVLGIHARCGTVAADGRDSPGNGLERLVALASSFTHRVTECCGRGVGAGGARHYRGMRRRDTAARVSNAAAANSTRYVPPKPQLRIGATRCCVLDRLTRPSRPSVPDRGIAAVGFGAALESEGRPGRASERG